MVYSPTLRFSDVDPQEIVWALNQLDQAQGGNNTVTVDPTVNSDNTQGYMAGMILLNTTNNRVWRALSVATGAAVWALEGVVPGVGVEPSTMLTQFGSGLGYFLEEGNIWRLAGAAVNPGSTANDNVLAVYSLPANSLDGLAGTNRGLSIFAQGNLAANANNKTCKIIFNATTAVVGSAVTGGTAIATTGVSAGNNIGWQLTANVFKYGAANSNTQVAQQTGVVLGATHGGIGLSQLLTATENAPILIAITGNAATTATDIGLYIAEINALN